MQATAKTTTQLHQQADPEFAWLHSRSILQTACLLLLALSAVPTTFAQTVSVESDESVDFTKFKTFAIRDGKLSSRSPALNSELTKKRIAAEIERALTAKHLTVGTDQVDLNVSFEFGSARVLEPWRGAGYRNIEGKSAVRCLSLMILPQ